MGTRSSTRKNLKNLIKLVLRSRGLVMSRPNSLTRPRTARLSLDLLTSSTPAIYSPASLLAQDRVDVLTDTSSRARNLSSIKRRPRREGDCNCLQVDPNTASAVTTLQDQLAWEPCFLRKSKCQILWLSGLLFLIGLNTK